VFASVARTFKEKSVGTSPALRQMLHLTGLYVDKWLEDYAEGRFMERSLVLVAYPPDPPDDVDGAVVLTGYEPEEILEQIAAGKVLGAVELHADLTKALEDDPPVLVVLAAHTEKGWAGFRVKLKPIYLSKGGSA
jgi:hypothetical protein